MTKIESPEYARFHYLRPEIGYYDIEQAKAELEECYDMYDDGDNISCAILEWKLKWFGDGEDD